MTLNLIYIAPFNILSSIKYNFINYLKPRDRTKTDFIQDSSMKVRGILPSLPVIN